MLKRLMWDGQDETSGRWFTRVWKNRYHYIILLLCVINIALACVNAGLWIMAAIQKLFVAADFTSFYTGYHIIKSGEGRQLYDAALQSMYQQQFMGGISFEGGVLLFPNPPHVAVVFSLLSFLKLEAAFYLWSAILFGLLILGLQRLNKLFLHWIPPERAVLVITVLAFWPLTYSFLLGQFSLFLLLGVISLYAAIKQSKAIQGGLGLLFLSIKPHLLLIPGMTTLNRRNFRFAVAGAFMFIILFIGTVLIIGFKPWLDYLQSLITMGSFFNQYGVNPNTEYTLRGLLTNLLGNSQPGLINLISGIFLVISMVVVWYLWQKAATEGQSRIELLFAFSVTLTVFSSLHLNPHDSLLLVLPAAVFYDYLRRCDMPRRSYSILMLLSPMVFLWDGFQDVYLLGVFRPPVVMELVLLVWITYYLVHVQRHAESTPDNISTSRSE